MNERIRERRRSVNRDRGRRRATVAFLAALALAGVVLFLWFRSTDAFAVKKVVAGAPVRFSQEELAQALSGAVGQNLFRISTATYEEALARIPYVRHAEVHRCFPDTLEVEVTEYEPVARLKTAEGTIWLVGDDGRVLEKVAGGPRGLDLPLLVAESLADLAEGKTLPDSVLGVLSAISLLGGDLVPQGLVDLQKVVVGMDGTSVLVLKDGTKIRLGDAEGFEKKLKVAVAVLKRESREDQQLEYIDVSVPERVAVKYR